MTVDPRSSTVAKVFDLVADTYDDVGVPWFGPIAQGLVDVLRPKPGETALDVGCGKGAATFLLADRVRPDGHVIGVDLSEGMLAQARRLAEQRGVTVDWRLADALDPGLAPGSVDLVASSLVLFFLPDPRQALQAWRTIVRDGGRVAATTFGRFDPAIDTLGDLLDPYLPPQSLDARAPVEDQPFASDAGVERMFAGAGLLDVVTTHLAVEARLTSVEHWREWSKSLGQRAMWEKVPAEELPGLMAAAGEIYDAHADSDGVLVTSNDIRVTLGRS